MFKLLGHFLALVAMMASVLNAQCAVSCSLQSEPGGINRTQHSCCPHQDTPKPKEHRHDVSCPQPLPAASKDRAEHTSASSGSIAAMAMADFSHQCRPLTAQTFLDPLQPADSPGLSQPPSISILRI